MKTTLFLIGCASAQNMKQFGARKNNDWIKCAGDNVNCADGNHMNQADAVCVSRMLKQVSNTNDPDYINARNVDGDLDRNNINNIYPRCMTNADKDYWLGQNMVKDDLTGITASYSYIPYIAPQPTNTNTNTVTTPTETKVQLYKTCNEGDDSVCKDWFGAAGMSGSVCCWRAELVTIPSNYANDD